MEITEQNREYMDDGKQELVLTILASPKDVDKASKEFFADIQKRELKGFRKGKAPKAVLEQSVGGHENAMGGVAETLINGQAYKLIDDADILFIENPDFNVDTTLEEGKPFKFTVSGAVAPIMKLTDYDPVSIEMPSEEVTDEEIDRQLEALQDYYHSFEEIDDDEHIAEMGDYLMATITVSDSNDKPVGGLSAKSRMIGLGEGVMPETFDENVIGSKVGDILEFDFDAINPDGTSDYGDGHLHAVVDVKGFRRKILPAIDDELAVKVGCVDKDDLYKEMRRNIGMQKNKELPKIKVDRAIEKLIEKLDGEVPEYYVDFIRQDVGREFMQNMEKQGTNLQQWMLQNSVEGDALKEKIDKEAKYRASIDCALEALFTEKDLNIEDSDIDAMFEGEEGKDSRKQWESSNRMADVRKIARQTKATDYLTDNAIVTEVS